MCTAHQGPSLAHIGNTYQPGGRTTPEQQHETYDFLGARAHCTLQPRHDYPGGKHSYHRHTFGGRIPHGSTAVFEARGQSSDDHPRDRYVGTWNCVRMIPFLLLRGDGGVSAGKCLAME